MVLTDLIKPFFLVIYLQNRVEVRYFSDNPNHKNADRGISLLISH